MASTTTIRPRALVRASGGPRYAVALAVDALGTGLLRPFLLLYGVTVLRLSAPVTGIAMTAGVVVGLVCMPAVGRWLDRGARSTVVAASMLVRVLGVALLLAAPAGTEQTGYSHIFDQPGKVALSFQGTVPPAAIPS
ncbi:hypothetical protein ACWEJ6_44005, partial [Nonomuraea sp. NPDC004702]